MASLVPCVCLLPYSYIAYRNKLEASFYFYSDPSSDWDLADHLVLAAVVLEFLSPGSIYALSSRLTITPIICCANKIITTVKSPHGDYILQSKLHARPHI